MTYTLTLETFNGSTKKINLSTKGQVAQFINNYPSQLPVGIPFSITSRYFRKGILRRTRRSWNYPWKGGKVNDIRNF